LRRSLFGGGNRPFVVAVRSTQAAVMTLVGKAVIDGLTIRGVIQCRNPIRQ